MMLSCYQYGFTIPVALSGSSEHHRRVAFQPVFYANPGRRAMALTGRETASLSG
jgi:hypothetical protein